MPVITSKVDVCNLSLSGPSGIRNTINDIDTPTTDKEILFAQWYDLIRQVMLKKLMPNFALSRRVVSSQAAPAFGYTYAFEYPSDCLKLLGIGDADCKGDIQYSVEANQILTDTEFAGGMPIRFIRDVTDVSSMSPEFLISFANELGAVTGLAVTQDPGKVKAARGLSAESSMNSTAANAQENPPVRRNVSRFRAGRRFIMEPTDTYPTGKK